MWRKVKTNKFCDRIGCWERAQFVLLTFDKKPVGYYCADCAIDIFKSFNTHKIWQGVDLIKLALEVFGDEYREKIEKIIPKNLKRVKRAKLIRKYGRVGKLREVP